MSFQLGHRLIFGFVLLLPNFCIGATAFKWVGGKEPAKITVPKTGKVNIGNFFNLSSKEDWGQVVYNVANKYPTSQPWITWGVGDWSQGRSSETWENGDNFLPDDKNLEYLTYLDGLGVKIFLEVRPGSANVLNLIDTYMKKFGVLKNVAGFGVDMEFYNWKGGKDIDANAMLAKLKTYNPNHKLFFKHWESGNMPSNRTSEMIYFCTSSEEPPAKLIADHAKFCNDLAPAPCGFQIGYPADEPLKGLHAHIDAGDYDGWQSMNDPIKEMGDGLLKAVTSNTQELGFVWVTVKSERFPWDLTKGATIPSSVARELPSPGRFLRAERTSGGLTLRLAGADGEISVAAAADIMGRKVVAAQGAGFASGRYFLRTDGQTLSASLAK